MKTKLKKKNQKSKKNIMDDLSDNGRGVTMFPPYFLALYLTWTTVLVLLKRRQGVTKKRIFFLRFHNMKYM